jgi:protein gp37
VQWGPHGDRLRTSEANWKQPPRWAKAARGTGERPRVFCASLADWLDNKAPQEWRVDLAALIATTPELDWLLLTKRPENYKKLAPWKEPLLDRVFLEDRLDPLEGLVDRLFRGHPVVHYVEHGDAEDML